MGKKTWQDRLTQTIAFIEGEGHGSMQKAQWDVVVDALKDWHRDAPLGDRQAISNLMSFDKDKTGRESSKEGRACRRAAILLGCAFRFPLDQRTFKAISDEKRKKSQSARSLLRATLADCHDRAASLPAKGESVIQRLMTSPEAFLNENVLLPSCGAEGGRQWFYVSLSGERWQLTRAKTEPDGFATIQAMTVPPTLFSSVEGDGSLTGTRSEDSAGCRLMLTTQFTGCSFCFSIKGNSLVAAHVDPGGGVGRGGTTTGEEVRVAMEKHTRFKNHNGGTFNVYGRRAYATDGFGYGQRKDQGSNVGLRQMVVVGVFRSDEWELYSQQIFVDGSKLVQRIDKP